MLAWNEWHDDNVGEGLMLDLEDRVISATAASVFAVRGILPVRELAGRAWPAGPVTRRLPSRWQAAGLPLQVPA